ncbi:MAG: type II toxin-antitoxin system VapC family toxin [Moorellaceae bacterium]
MAKSVLLDTGVLIALLRNLPGVKEFMKRLASEATLLVSAVTVVEIWQGARPVEMEKTRLLFEALKVIPLDENLAEQAGQLAGQLRQSGITIGLADTVIAATGIQTKAPIITTNPKHFTLISELVVRDLREELAPYLLGPW